MNVSPPPHWPRGPWSVAPPTTGPSVADGLPRSAGPRLAGRHSGCASSSPSTTSCQARSISSAGTTPGRRQAARNLLFSSRVGRHARRAGRTLPQPRGGPGGPASGRRIAEDLGISQMHVSRLITHCCSRLRDQALRDQDPVRDQDQRDHPRGPCEDPRRPARNVAGAGPAVRATGRSPKAWTDGNPRTTPKAKLTAAATPRPPVVSEGPQGRHRGLRNRPRGRRRRRRRAGTLVRTVNWASRQVSCWPVRHRAPHSQRHMTGHHVHRPAFRHGERPRRSGAEQRQHPRHRSRRAQWHAHQRRHLGAGEYRCARRVVAEALDVLGLDLERTVPGPAPPRAPPGSRPGPARPSPEAARRWPGPRGRGRSHAAARRRPGRPRSSRRSARTAPRRLRRAPTSLPRAGVGAAWTPWCRPCP